VTDSKPVFLNDRLLQVPAGTTVAGLLAEHEPALLADLRAGRAMATDARGLPVAADAELAAGAVLRVFRSARTATASDDA
jgi:hypothetical protein